MTIILIYFDSGMYGGERVPGFDGQKGIKGDMGYQGKPGLPGIKGNITLNE